MTAIFLILNVWKDNYQPYLSTCDTQPIVIESQLPQFVATLTDEEVRQPLHTVGTKSIVTQVQLHQLGLGVHDAIAKVTLKVQRVISMG